MNKYISTISVKGQTIKTLVFADSLIHARLILQYQFGMKSIISGPLKTNNEEKDYQLIDEVITNIKTMKPLTPAQARIDSLKKQKDTANKLLQAERSRQKIVQARQQIYKAVTKK